MSASIPITGPGKYDYLATHVREKANAAFVLVLVVGGNLGGGFAVQSRDPELLQKVPDLLEEMARKIRAGEGVA